MTLVRTILGLGAVALGLGCGSPRESTSPHAASTDVPAGTEVSVKLANGVATDSSFAGQPFAMTVLQPLKGADGTVAVRAGATLSGHVIDLDTSRTPSLRLKFDSIQTTAGQAPVYATLGGAQPSSAIARTDEVYGPGLGFDAIIRRSQAVQGTAIGGGPPVIRLPAGTELKVVLMQPLALPRNQSGSK